MISVRLPRHSPPKNGEQSKRPVLAKGKGAAKATDATTLPSGAGGGCKGPKHCDCQNEGHDEGERNVEVFSHYVQLMVTEIKRNNWFRKQGRL